MAVAVAALLLYKATAADLLAFAIVLPVVAAVADVLAVPAAAAAALLPAWGRGAAARCVFVVAAFVEGANK